MTTTGTTLTATPFITGTTTTEVEVRAAELTASAAELLPAPTRVTGLRTATSLGAAKFTTLPALPPGLSTATPKQLEDTLNRVARAASTRVPLAATARAERPGAIPHAEAPASAAEHRVAAALAAEERTAAVVGIGNRGFRYVFGNGRSSMRRTKLNFDKFPCANLPKLAVLAILLTGWFPTHSMALQPGQKTFSSPEDASDALVTAVQSNDESAMLAILGPGGKQIVSSGDDTEDAHSRADFVQKYREMHRLVREPDGTTTLYIGAKNWPTPIPLVNKGNSWYFDTEAGKKEILYRRIGRNEISTIRVCQELVTAEREYYSAQHNEYAQKIFSDEGQHNGLYWKAADGEPQSPIGPLVASAVAEGYAKSQDGAPTPYRGYYYRILTRQGKHNPGGAKSYIANGKMTEGFAFVAYPAEYRSSGVMTFIVNEFGVTYQKDLGKKTDALARAMKEYNPDSSWQRAEGQQEENAADLKTK